jgi:hypothetical protein
MKYIECRSNISNFVQAVLVVFHIQLLHGIPISYGIRFPVLFEPDNGVLPIFGISQKYTDFDSVGKISNRPETRYYPELPTTGVKKTHQSASPSLFRKGVTQDDFLVSRE